MNQKATILTRLHTCKLPKADDLRYILHIKHLSHQQSPLLLSPSTAMHMFHTVRVDYKSLYLIFLPPPRQTNKHSLWKVCKHCTKFYTGMGASVQIKEHSQGLFIFSFIFFSIVRNGREGCTKWEWVYSTVHILDTALKRF